MPPKESLRQWVSSPTARAPGAGAPHPRAAQGGRELRPLPAVGGRAECLLTQLNSREMS